MERSFTDQERELKEAIRRAKNILDRTSPVRRDVYERLIRCFQSPNPSLKILAAGNIKFFFTDFLDLEEVAINGIYDLCEDQLPKVRKEGYAAITQISTASHKWIKRNADVLLQLLQSDEPDEVIIVKKALCEHLDMDPKVTLGVLCDQFAPLSTDADEDEQVMRDRLRSLVIAFLTGEAKRAIVERHAVSASAVSSVLTRDMLEVIPRLTLKDISMLVKDLLVWLPAYKQDSQAGARLLRALLECAAAGLRKDLRAGKETTLSNSRPYINLANYITLEKPIAPPMILLRFYLTSLAGKIALQKMTQDTQVSVIYELIEILGACSNGPDSQNAQDVTTLRHHIIDASPFLLEALEKIGVANPKAANASMGLLRLVKQRKEESSWTLPPNLIMTLQSMLSQPAIERLRALQELIRSTLLGTNRPLPPPQHLVPLKPLHSPVSLKRNLDGNMPNTSLLTHSAPAPVRRVIALPSTRAPIRDQPMVDVSSTNGDNQRTAVPPPNLESLRPTKRMKNSEDTQEQPSPTSTLEATAKPSLLSRLGNVVNTPTQSGDPFRQHNLASRSYPPRAQANAGLGPTGPPPLPQPVVNRVSSQALPFRPQDSTPLSAPSPAPAFLSIGLSIKGAASKGDTMPLTLLDRLGREDASPANGAMPNTGYIPTSAVNQANMGIRIANAAGNTNSIGDVGGPRGLVRPQQTGPGPGSGLSFRRG